MLEVSCYHGTSFDF